MLSLVVVFLVVNLLTVLILLLVYLLLFRPSQFPPVGLAVSVDLLIGFLLVLFRARRLSL